MTQARNRKRTVKESIRQGLEVNPGPSTVLTREQMIFEWCLRGLAATKREEFAYRHLTEFELQVLVWMSRNLYRILLCDLDRQTFDDILAEALYHPNNATRFLLAGGEVNPGPGKDTYIAVRVYNKRRVRCSLDGLPMSTADSARVSVKGHPHAVCTKCRVVLATLPNGAGFVHPAKPKLKLVRKDLFPGGCSDGFQSDEEPSSSSDAVAAAPAPPPSPVPTIATSTEEGDSQDGDYPYVPSPWRVHSPPFDRFSGTFVEMPESDQTEVAIPAPEYDYGEPPLPPRDERDFVVYRPDGSSVPPLTPPAVPVPPISGPTMLMGKRSLIKAAPESEEYLRGYIPQSRQEFEALDRLVNPMCVVDRLLSGEVEYHVEEYKDEYGGEQRLGVNRNVKEIQEDLGLAKVVISRNRFSWKRWLVSCFGEISKYVALFNLVAAIVAPTEERSRAHVGIAYASLTAAATTSQLLQRYMPGLKSATYAPEQTEVVFCPHMLSSALSEYRSKEKVDASIDSKLLRQACLPVKDSIALQVQRGTSLVARAIAESGSETLGFRHAHQPSLQLRGGVHY